MRSQFGIRTVTDAVARAVVLAQGALIERDAGSV